MAKTFSVTGYAVNKRGNTVGVQYDVQATSTEQAMVSALRLATEEGYRFVRLTSAIAQEADHA
jgi:hypothetical protein